MPKPSIGWKTSGKIDGRFLCAGAIRLDLINREAKLNDKIIALPPCTFEYLVTLLRNSPHPVSYQDLVQQSQGYHLSRLEAQDLSRFRIHILRKALESEPESPQYILAVAGFGYRLTV